MKICASLLKTATVSNTNRGSVVAMRRKAQKEEPPFDYTSDDASVRELDLFAENEYSIYNQFKSIVENVKRRIGNGTYDEKLAPRLWTYWYDSAAKAYKREFGYQFPPAVRKRAAEERATTEFEKIMKGIWGREKAEI